MRKKYKLRQAALAIFTSLRKRLHTFLYTPFPPLSINRFRVVKTLLSQKHPLIAARVILPGIFIGIVGSIGLITTINYSPHPAKALGDTANLWVDTNGGTCTRSATPAAYNDAAACGSFDAANDACQNGDTVFIKTGSYASQSFSGSNSRTSQCSISATSGETVTTSGLNFGGSSWIALSDVTVTGGTSSAPKTVSLGGGSSTTADHVTITNVSAYPGRIFMKGTYLTVQGGEFGGYDACLTGSEDDGIQVSYVTLASSNITIDGIYLHDIRRTCGSTHTDCIQFLGVDGGVIKNSRIQNCPTTGIIARPQGGSNVLNNLRIENNFVGPVLDGSEAYNIGTSPDNCTNIVISYNTFADGGSIDCVTTTGNTVRGNVIAGTASCADATYSYNAWSSGTACGTSGRICTASYVDAANRNYHLLSSDTCAIDRGDPANFPSTDFDGDVRPQASLADLGADEVVVPAGPTANLWVDSSGGTCTRQATPSTYVDSQACDTFDAAWDAASAGDTIRVKNGSYGIQHISGDKTSETFIIGESKSGVVVSGPDQDCYSAFGVSTEFCAEANHMTLEDVTINAGTNQNRAVGSLIVADDVTYRNVDVLGDFPDIYINDGGNGGNRFHWDGGTWGNPNPPARGCGANGFAGGEPVWVDGADDVTIESVTFNKQTVLLTGACAPPNNGHLEFLRLEDNTDNFTLRNNIYMPGSDSGSGYIFMSVNTNNNMKIIGNLFADNGGSTWAQVSNPCDWTIAYNTFDPSGDDGAVFACDTITWVGNLGPASAYPGCFGTHTKNVWGGSGSCGTDTFVGTTGLGVDSSGHLQAGSLAIDAGEANTASDLCTSISGLDSLDFEGDTRPQGAACDAGADEVTGGGSDTTSPTVSISAPSASAKLRGSVAVTASASDNTGVVGVQFKLDGINLGSEDTSSPYSITWDTTTATNGTHSLTAVARDAAGNTKTSTSVSVTVDNAAPTVSITTPANGATVSGSSVSITASAADTGGSGLAGVQFKLDGSGLLGAEDTVAPYSFTWDTTTLGDGSHTLTATARDAAGNTRTSSIITVTVDNSSPPPPDTTAPPAPSGLTKTGSTTSTISLSWNAVSDNSGGSGLSGYNIYRNGSFVTKVIGLTSYTDTGLAAGTSYSYQVSAVDNAANESAKSTSLSAATTAASSGGGTPKVKGDCNSDSHVTLVDLSILLSHYGKSYAAADFDSSGSVSLGDLSILLSNYGK